MSRIVTKLEKAQKALAKIEHKKRTWESDWRRKQEIWHEIAERLNSSKDELKEHWELVMDLYQEKYNTEK